MILLLLQITSMGVSLPIETLPQAFRNLHLCLPIELRCKIVSNTYSWSGYDITPTIIILLVLFIISMCS